MRGSRRATQFLMFILALALSGMFSFSGNTVATADVRPFPKYEMTFQKIWGKKDPNWSPGQEGDGCLREENPRITHLTTFAFHAMLNQCDGVRTKIRFYLAEDSPGSPTLQFRFGTTWQYEREVNPEPNENILKPVENFTYDGKPVSKEQYDPDNPAVVDSEGNMVRMGDGTGWFEPFHYVFEDTFGAGEEHTIQFDAYLPAHAGKGGLTWGTGSTGDTSGGSIGATANGLKVELPAKMDFRYVLHSEYLAARGFAQDAELTKDFDLPGLPERTWATSQTGIKDTTFDLIQCLEEEGQQLRDVRSSLPVNEIYPELPFSELTLFEDRSGSPGFARWPWQFSTFQDGNWDPKTRLRVMNRINGNFEPYLKQDGSYMSLPFKPTVESLIAEIPGYEYVDNDITILEKGKFIVDQPANKYDYEPAPNVLLRRFMHKNTQHFYYTYRPIPGTFELEKSAISYDWNAADKDYVSRTSPLAGAEFELYEVVDTTASACGLEPDLTDTEKVQVCEYRQPENAAQFQEQAKQDPTNCTEQTVRKITLDGTNGSFTTDAEGKFTPAGEPALDPGKYLLKEVAAPEDHVILNEWIPFEIPIQDEEHAGVVKVAAENYLTPPPPPEEPPSEEPPSEEPPSEEPPSEEPPSKDTPPEKPEKPVLPPDTGDSGANTLASPLVNLLLANW